MSDMDEQTRLALVHLITVGLRSGELLEREGVLDLVNMLDGEPRPERPLNKTERVMRQAS